MDMSDEALDRLMFAHERRQDKVRSAWVAACAAGGPDPHIGAWQQIGWLGSHTLDSDEFVQLVAADIQQQGAPTTWQKFIDHYNRLLVERSHIFMRRYMLDKDQPLGEGGFGLVLRGTRTDNDTAYAIKISRKEALSRSALVNLDNEIRLWSRIQHPGVCGCFDVFELPGQIVMVTELCPGGCLLDQLCEVEQFTEEHAKQISRQVSNAVVHLHELGIAHRDIKPENVLCTDTDPHLRGHIKLCDFGFAAEFNKDHSKDNKDFKQLIGTPEYLAPEMVADLMRVRKREPAHGYTFKVDYWALGCLVYELLAGEPPFFSEDDETQYDLTLHAPLQFPAHHFEEVTPDARALLEGLLDRRPDQRLGMELPGHEWLASASPQRGLHRSASTSTNLLNRKAAAQNTKEIRKNRRLRGAMSKVVAARRFSNAGIARASAASQSSWAVDDDDEHATGGE